MVDETVPSQKAIWDERVSGIKNAIWDWFESHPITGVALLVLSCVILFLLILGGSLKKVGPFEFSNRSKKSNSSRKQKLRRQITDLPAPAPKNKATRLPARLRRITKTLESGRRKRILIHCSNRGYAEELGKLLYYRLEQEKIGNHIGWVSYQNLQTDADLIDSPGFKGLPSASFERISRTSSTSWGRSSWMLILPPLSRTSMI